ncbi:MAG: hypothetical protein DRN27_02015 [Thermoplasmata archaeon]|nr:MAG: hypothetical protein DRN27_02015 [Thermoplasmata archaeon]
MKKTIRIILITILIGLNISFIPNILASVPETSVALQVSFAENPVVLAPGSNGYIELILDNIGTETVKYIDIETSNYDKSVITYQGNWDVYIGSLDGGESTTLIYEFSISSSADPGLYQIIFESDSTASDTKITAFIRVEDSSLLDIESVAPSLINIGEISTLTFNISNNGGNSISSILFTWDVEDSLILPIGADNRISIDLIPANNYTKIPVTLMASPTITPGVYPLAITMTYYDETGNIQTITSNVGIQVSGGTDFEIILQQSITGGTTFAVANTGANTASSVIVSIPKQPNYSTSGSSSASLGNLDAGDYTLASFQLTEMNQNNTKRPGFNQEFSNMPSDFDPSMFESMKNKSFGGAMSDNLIVEISYTDLYGLRQIVEKEVKINSMSSSGSSYMASRFGTGDISGKSALSGQQDPIISTGTMYIIIGIVGILMIVLLLQFGKKKKIPYISKIMKGKNNENS